MRRLAFYILPILAICCTRDLSEIYAENVFPFSGVDTFFPAVNRERCDTAIGDLNELEYARILRQLGEESLSKAYLNKDVVRLTVFPTFDAYFTIRIERLECGDIRLIQKGTYKRGWAAEFDSAKSYVVHRIEYDSIANSYFHVKVRETWQGETKEYHFKKPVNPITSNSEVILKREDWSNFVSQLNKSGYYSMPTQISKWGFDGSHYLIETHSKAGYYVVDRWSPDNGPFKDIVNYMLHLAKRDTEN